MLNVNVNDNVNVNVNVNENVLFTVDYKKWFIAVNSRKWKNFGELRKFMLDHKNLECPHDCRIPVPSKDSEGVVHMVKPQPVTLYKPEVIESKNFDKQAEPQLKVEEKPTKKLNLFEKIKAARLKRKALAEHKEFIMVEDPKDISKKVKKVVDTTKKADEKIRKLILLLKSRVKDKKDRTLSSSCINAKLYDSFVVTPELLKTSGDAFKCHDFKDFDFFMNYEQMCKILPCTCGQAKSVILNDLPKAYFDDFQYYSACPRVMACCARRVLSQHNQPDKQFCNRFMTWFKETWGPKLIKSIEKNFKVDVIGWFKKLKTGNKQKEVLHMFNSRDDWDIQYAFYDPYYTGFVKGQTQRKGEKPRQIGNPSETSKAVGMPANSAIEEIMKDVYGDACGFGLSYQDRSDIFKRNFKGSKFVTLDVSGMDQSHNDVMKQAWYWFIDQICKLKADQIEKFTSIELFKTEMCKEFSRINYSTFIKNHPVKLFDLYLKDKMVSGSAYTSILNTFLMINYCYYVGHLLKAKILPHASGDDVLVFIPSYISDKEIRRAFYKVFSWPKNDKPHGNGLYLKYCIISDNPLDVKPCSTECFICPKCGPKLTRPFYKLLYNEFVSNKAHQLQIAGLDIASYRKMLWLADMAWAKGLDSAERMLDAIGVRSDRSMRDILHQVETLVPGKGKIIGKDNGIDLQKLVWDLYGGERRQVNCPKCSIGYERMLRYKYKLNFRRVNAMVNAILNHPKKGAMLLRRYLNFYEDYDSAQESAIPKELAKQILEEDQVLSNSKLSGKTYTRRHQVVPPLMMQHVFRSYMKAREKLELPCDERKLMKHYISVEVQSKPKPTIIQQIADLVNDLRKEPRYTSE